MARKSPGKRGDILAWAGMAGVMVAAIAIARRDRSATGRANVAAPTVRLPSTTERLPSPSEMRDAAADLEQAAARARQAAADLERVKADLDEKQKALELVKADADANAERTKHDLEEARAKLEARQGDLEKASREAEARVRAASRDLERLRHQQLSMPSPSGRDPARALGKRITTTPPNVPTMVPPGAAGVPALSTLTLPPSVVRVPIPKESRSGVSMDQAARFAAVSGPRRLSSEEFNPSTGEITWPSALADGRYADLTATIERPFLERAARGGGFSAAEQSRVEVAIDALEQRLRTHMTKHSTGRYGAAQTFLDSLRAESLAVREKSHP